jgi:hypothetical protein
MNQLSGAFFIKSKNKNPVNIIDATHNNAKRKREIHAAHSFSHAPGMLFLIS